MQSATRFSTIILGGCLIAAFGLLGHQLANGLIAFKQMNRTVAVKGLAAREVPADVAIWPIRFREGANDLGTLVKDVRTKNDKIVAFLHDRGFTGQEISISPPAIVDNETLNYNTGQKKFRYTAETDITVYTTNVARVRQSRQEILELAAAGIAIASDDYEARTEYLFTGLNTLKPAMIEEATRNAREAGEKFAQDSNSKLGKIKSARQGIFQIRNRDKNTPDIKTVRVISTIEYYLTD